MTVEPDNPVPSVLGCVRQAPCVVDERAMRQDGRGADAGERVSDCVMPPQRACLLASFHFLIAVRRGSPLCRIPCPIAKF